MIDDYKVQEYAITIAVVGSQEIAELNRRFRNVEGTTDVLSFLIEGEPLEGEIYLNIDMVERTAASEGTTIQYQLFKLLIHGSLHLLGFHHGTAEEEAENNALMDDYVRRFELI